MGRYIEQWERLAAQAAARVGDADRELLELAPYQRWEEIDPGKAESEEARKALKRIELEKYRLDDYPWGDY